MSVEDNRKYSFDGEFRNGGCVRNINMRARLSVSVRRVKGKPNREKREETVLFFLRSIQLFGWLDRY